MASKHREQKAIAAVACPDCGMERGRPCNRSAAKGRSVPGAMKGRLFVCAGRIKAWQMIRDGEIKDGE